MDNVLLKDGEKYGGQYVATKSFKDRKVVTYGIDPSKVILNIDYPRRLFSVSLPGKTLKNKANGKEN